MKTLVTSSSGDKLDSLLLDKYERTDRTTKRPAPLPDPTHARGA